MMPVLLLARAHLIGAVLPSVRPCGHCAVLPKHAMARRAVPIVNRIIIGYSLKYQKVTLSIKK